MQAKPKKILGLLTVVGLIMLLGGCTSPPAKIGVMDMQQVLDESERAAALREQLTEIGNDLENNYETKEEDLSSEKQEKEQERIYQQFVENKKELEGKLNQEINNVLQKISQEKNIDIILYKNGVHYGGLNITDQVIKRLDEKGTKDGADNGSE